MNRIAMNIEFVSAWAQLSHHAKRALKAYATKPTERNQCYIVGYLTATRECERIDDDAYTYLLAGVDSAEMHEAILAAV